MGTRNLTMVICKEKTKVAQYGQWDGMPKHMGLDILDILRKCDLKKFKEKVEKLRFFIDEEIEELNEDFEKSLEERPWLSRDLGAKILHAIYFGKFKRFLNYNGTEIIKCKVDALVDSSKFAADSLLCEWAYVIDLDKEVLEVYGGFNTAVLDKGERFADMKPEDDEYYPVKLVKSYDLNSLPTNEDFVKECDPPENEDEE